MINGEIVLHFERAAVVAKHFRFFVCLFVSMLVLRGTEMAPVPDSVLMCLAVSYTVSSDPWNDGKSGGVGSHAHRHGWRILQRHREERTQTVGPPH